MLAGHSFGGLICLALAQRRPEVVRAVVAYEAPQMWAPWWPGSTAGNEAMAVPDPEDAAEGFLRRMIGDATWERLPAAMRAERRARGTPSSPRCGRCARPTRPRTTRPPSPSPWSPRSAPRPGRHHMRATDDLARTAPRGELRVVEGADHGAHLTHPNEFADLVRRALERAGEPILGGA